MQLKLYINSHLTAQTPAALGIASATLSLLSMAPDQLRLSTERSLNNPPLAYNDKVLLVRIVGSTETTLFSGRVTAIRKAADPVNHGHDIIILGPWHDLEQIVYKQLARIYGDGAMTDSYASRVILSDNDHSVQTMLQDIIAYAVNQGGAEMAATPILENIAMTLPRDEQEGLTCAGAIQRLLRFFPDATCAFDYTTATPTLKVLRKETTTSLADAAISGIDIEPLYDRAIDRVEIEVYRTHDIDGVSKVTIDRLRYPSDEASWVDGSALKNTLSVPMEMDGRAVAYEKARIESMKLPANLGTTVDTEVKNWLKQRIEDITENIFDWPEDVTVEYETRRVLSIDDDGEPVYETKTGAAARLQFPREALSSIPHWVDTTAEATVTVTFPRKVEAREIGGVKYDIGETENEVYTLNFTACSKPSGNYKRLSSSTAAEICPTSLPQHLYNSWHRVFVEGRVSLWLTNDTVIPAVGDIITGYPGEVAGTLALVQGVTLGDTDQLELTLGPPEHLSPHDLVELLRGFRTRRPVTHNKVNEGDDLSGLDTGSATATRSSGKSASLPTKTNIHGATDKNKKVTIDPDVITGNNKEVKLREVTLLTYNATTKKLQPTKAFVLATQPVNDGNEVEVGGGPLPDKAYLVNNRTTAKIEVIPENESNYDATPPKLKITLPSHNPSSGVEENLELEVDITDLKGQDGEDGNDGVSWGVTVAENTETSYKLTFTSSSGEAFTTPNLKGEGSSESGEQQEVTVITGVQYDMNSHKLQYKTRKIKFSGTAEAESDWTDFATAVAHSSQHQ